MIRVFITDYGVYSDGIYGVISKLPKGTWVILRDRNLVERAEYAGKIQKICKKRGLQFVPSGNILRVKSDFIHCSLFWNKPPEIIRYSKNKSLIISCHSLLDAQKAVAYGAKYILLSPIFKTQSHPDSSSLGLHRAFKIANHFSDSCVKFVALGGVDEKKYRILKNLDFKNKFVGFAGIRWRFNKKA